MQRTAAPAMGPTRTASSAGNAPLRTRRRQRWLRPACLVIIALFLLWPWVSPAADSQPGSPHPRLARMLERAGERVSLVDDRGHASRQFSLRLRQGALTDGGANIGVEYVSQRLRQEDPPRQRSDEIGPDQLVLAAFDRQGTARYAYIINNALHVRGESVDESGQMHRRDELLADAGTDLSVPASINVGEIRLYRPLAGADGEVELQYLSSAPVPEAP